MAKIEHLHLYNWKDIADSYKHTLVIGNGASIAVNPSFNYSSLYLSAKESGLVSKEANNLFEYFETKDFEYILRLLSNAHDINVALKISEDQTVKIHYAIRNALINVVQQLHVTYDQVAPVIPNVISFLEQFETVFSLNYDLILYWAILWANDNDANKYFIDCFIKNGAFEEDWQWLRKKYKGKDTTLVFYPHGNLALTTKNGETIKISRGKIVTEVENAMVLISRDLMKTIQEAWKSKGSVPLFVSEGSSKQKLMAIQRNGYLNSVYESALPVNNGTITIYGWSIGDQDEHILSRLISGRPKKIAISIYKSEDWEGKAFEMRNKILKIYFQKHRDAPEEIMFYDSSSQGCWKN